MKSNVNRIGLVDASLSHMRSHGHDLSSEDVAFIWKAAQGLATQREIDEWCTGLAEKSPGKASNQSASTIATAETVSWLLEADALLSRFKGSLDTLPVDPEV